MGADGEGALRIAAPHPECHPPSLLPASGHGAALRALSDGEGGGAESSVQRAAVGGEGGEGRGEKLNTKEKKQSMERSCAATATQGASGRAGIYEINGNLCK